MACEEKVRVMYSGKKQRKGLRLAGIPMVAVRRRDGNV